MQYQIALRTMHPAEIIGFFPMSEVGTPPATLDVEQRFDIQAAENFNEQRPLGAQRYDIGHPHWLSVPQPDH